MTVLPEHPREMLREIVVRLVGRAAEMVEGKAEFLLRRLLGGILLIAEGAHVEPGFERRKFRRRAVLVRRAQDQRLETLRLLESPEDLGRQKRANHRAQMLDAVDVGERAGDQYPCHCPILTSCQNHPPSGD